MNTELILHRRNKLLVYILWFSLVLGSVVTLKTNPDLTPTLVAAGGLIAIIATFLVWRRLFVKYMMYYIVLALAIISYILISASSGFTTYLIVYYCIAVCTLYNNFRPVLLSSVFALIFTNYFFVAERHTLFAGFDDSMLFSLNLFVVLTAVPLIAMAVFGERLQNQVTMRHEQAENSRRRLDSLLQSIMESVNELEQFNSDLYTNINTAGRISGEMTTAFREMSRSTENANASLSEINDSVNVLDEEITKVSDAALSLSRLSSESTALTDEGARKASQLGEEMQKMHAIIENTAEMIQALNERNDRIGEILAVIRGISEQTHLLALNAAIEAARAGEHGKGFEVVATEIRKLSETTRQSADHIIDILGDIQQRALGITNEVFLGQASASLGNKLSEEMIASQTDIANNTVVVAKNSMELADSVSKLKLASSNIAGGMASLSAVTEQNTAAAEQITAGIDRQDRNISEIVSQYHHVNELTKRLKKKTEL